MADWKDYLTCRSFRPMSDQDVLALYDLWATEADGTLSTDDLFDDDDRSAIVREVRAVLSAPTVKVAAQAIADCWDWTGNDDWTPESTAEWLRNYAGARGRR
jgi:hypothetical protein